jgi:hypothetical protein
VLLKSSKCLRFDFRCSAADIAATLTASVTPLADADDDACEALAASAIADGAGDGLLAMTFRAQGSCRHRSISEFRITQRENRGEVTGVILIEIK